MYDNFYLNRKLIIQAYRSFFFSIDIIFYFYFKEKRCIILFEIFCDVVFSQWYNTYMYIIKWGVYYIYTNP